MSDSSLHAHLAMARHPGTYALCIKRADGANDVDELTRNRYLMNGDYTMGHVVCQIRSRVNVKPHQALFILIDGNILPPVSALVSDVYREHVNTKDGMLHLYYRLENTFG